MSDERRNEAAAAVTPGPYSGTGGVKADTGKDPWHLLPWDALREIVKVLAFGARKYAERNWEKGLPHSRTVPAALRHIVSWWQDGEQKDPETGLHPLAHAACEILFALAFEVRGRKELDDRPGMPTPPTTPTLSKREQIALIVEKAWGEP